MQAAGERDGMWIRGAVSQTRAKKRMRSQCAIFKALNGREWGLSGCGGVPCCGGGTGLDQRAKGVFGTVVGGFRDAASKAWMR